MKLVRRIVETGEKVSDFFAYDLQDRYYKFLFNREMANGFEGINDSLSEDYKRAIKAFWQDRYHQKVDLRWFAHYTHCYGEESPYFLPDNIFHSVIEPYFNKSAYVKCMSNKNYFENWLPQLKHVHTIARYIKGVWYDSAFEKLCAEDVVKKLSAYPEFVAKPSVDSAGGAGVQFITEPIDVKGLSALEKSFSSDFIVQEVLHQHDCMNAIYPHSVNTVRVMTLNFHGDIHILSSVLRMGANGNRVDNMVSGGVNCAIYDNGRLCNKLYNAVGKRFDGHPNTGSVADRQVLNFQAVLDTARRAHQSLPYMGLISWDFAMDETLEPVLIEFNLKPQGLDLHQRENGPLFGDMTQEVLDEVFLGGKKK